MNNRALKLAAENVLNHWTLAEYGGKYKKREKTSISRYRRRLEKRELTRIKGGAYE